VIGKQDTYFVRRHSDSPCQYSEADIKVILGFLIDNIYVVFCDQVFQQSIGIPMGTNCAPLLAELFLYLYEAEYVQKLLWDNNKKKPKKTSHSLQPYMCFCIEPEGCLICLNNCSFAELSLFNYDSSRGMPL
jgi:hypothetical protein